MKIVDLVRRLNISRGTYYNHIADKNLPFEQLIQYGRVLRYDFSHDFPEMTRYSFEEPEPAYTAPATLKEAVEQRDYWRDKYYELMEQFHKLILERRTQG